jgi:hypothetical protein
MAMDELMFVFCGDNSAEDMLITRFEMDNDHKDYLKQIGFHFNTHSLVKDITNIGDIRHKNSCQLILENEVIPGHIRKTSDPCQYAPFSILEESQLVCQKLGIDYSSPSYDTVKKVNTKEYSTLVCEKMGLDSDSKIIYSAEEFRKIGKEYLKNSEFIVKDTLGVSGKGNLLISSIKVMNHIADYLSNQEKRGKRVMFIIEPFLQKEKDFSCQLYIKASGIVEIISVQMIDNKQFSYGGSYVAEDKFLNYLEVNGYFKIINDVATKIYQDGYYGHVCIDSMLLESGRIVPIVEINTRHSMSLIKHRIDRYLARYSLKCNFTYIPLHFKKSISFGNLIKKMKDRGILYTPEMEGGIIPMSSNALLINQIFRKDDDEQLRGRFYMACAFKNQLHKEKLNKDLINVFSENNIFAY